MADIDRQTHLVVFPVGYTELADDGSVMLAPNGTRVADGMSFEGTGGLVPKLGFPGVPDGYWGNYIAFCDSEAPEILVLDSVEPVL